MTSARTLIIVAVVPLAACLAIPAGCQAPPDTSPSPGMADPAPAPFNDPQISVVSPELRAWLGFQPAIITQDGERPMQVEVPVRNLTGNLYLIDYRFIFRDSEGRQLEPVMGWRLQALEPKQVVRLKAGALSTDAESYRLEVKWSR
jgi:hypothetical protein